MFIFSDQALHLGRQLTSRALTEGILEKDLRRVQLFELLDEESLLSVVARKPIRLQDHDSVELTALGAVA